MFESFVNSERYKTLQTRKKEVSTFESFVNSERYKTSNCGLSNRGGLRALLIQKDTKQMQHIETVSTCLRALLIQKDTKLAILPV